MNLIFAEIFSLSIQCTNHITKHKVKQAGFAEPHSSSTISWLGPEKNLGPKKFGSEKI